MEYKQVSDFRATGAVMPSDLIYSYNVTSALEQKTTVQQLMNFLMTNFASNRQTLSVVTDGQAVYTGLSYIPNLVNLWIAGIRLSPTMYTATDGQTITITSAGILARLKAGQAIDMDVIVSVTSNNMVASVISQLVSQRQTLTVTSNAQTLFTTGGYTPGLVNLYIAGSRISPSQYQALDGSTITITDSNVSGALTSGMAIDIDSAALLSTSNVATITAVQALDPGNQTAIGALTGAELISARQGTGLFASTLTKIAQWIVGTYQGFTQTGTGAVAQTVQGALSYFVRPEQFGAVGNNATDDTAALQRTLNAINAANGSNGGVILLRPGATYLFSTLTTYPGIRWQGGGERTTGLKCTASTGVGIVLADGNEFDGIQFNASAATAGSFFTQASGLSTVFTNCWIQDYFNFITHSGTVKFANFDAFNGAFNSAKITSACSVVTTNGGRLLCTNFRGNVSSAYGGKLPHTAVIITAATEVKITGYSNIQNHANAIAINIAAGGLLVDFETDGLILAANGGDALTIVTAATGNIRRIAVIGGNLDTNAGNGINASGNAGTITTLQALGGRIDGHTGNGVKLAGTITNVDIRASFDGNVAGSVSNTATSANTIISATGATDVLNAIAKSIGATGTTPTYTAQGPDANIGATWQLKGSSNFLLTSGNTGAGGSFEVSSFVPGYIMTDQSASSVRSRLLTDGNIIQLNWDGNADGSFSIPGFKIRYTASAANMLTTTPAIAGSPPALNAEGTDTNIDVRVVTKGTGLLSVNYGATAATTPANFSATKTIAIKSNGVTYYVPAATALW